MNETGIKYLRNQTILYGTGFMACCGILSLPVLGVNLPFVGGLILGTAVSILNISFLASFTVRALSCGRSSVTVVGFAFRTLIYGVSFGFSLIVMGNTAALGTAIGFVMAYAALFYLCGVKPRLFAERARRKNAIKTLATQPASAGFDYLYENAIRNADGKRRYVLVKNFSMTKYRGGTTYVTHKQFRKLKEIRGRHNA
ncbi:MAG: hypothetical protein LBQ21_05185 [Clostridiales Family XIII bacterium]|jgi:hypothetical protein|nr:hypothetical protein [Clostridiales Family XIII bacterium]